MLVNLSELLSDIQVKTVSAALAVLTSMITPALLISACGTFILSTSARLGRVVDRARGLSEKIEHIFHHSAELDLVDERTQMMLGQMAYVGRRAILLSQAMVIFYMAAGIFVATSVAIGLASVFWTAISWLPVIMGILGACFFFYGSVLLILEARIAVSGLREEMAFLDHFIKHHVTPREVKNERGD